MPLISRIIDISAVWFARMGGLMIALIGVLVTIDVISRNMFGLMAVNSLELSTYLFAAAIAFGMAYAATSGAHIRIDVVSSKLPAPQRRILDLLASLALAGLALFLLYFGFKVTSQSYERGVASNSVLAMPQAYPQAIWLLGLACFALTTTLMALRFATLLFSGHTTEADRLSGIGSPEQEVNEALDEVEGTAR